MITINNITLEEHKKNALSTVILEQLAQQPLKTAFTSAFEESPFAPDWDHTESQESSRSITNKK